MNLLKIVQDMNAQSVRWYANSSITTDRKILFISEFNCDNTEYEKYFATDESGYDEYFDQLDREEQLYDKVETLILVTDFLHKIPSHVLKFKNLKKLNVMGSRFWDLNFHQVPESVQTLILTDHTNLQYHCINGMERLVDLIEIDLDMRPFYLEYIFQWSQSRPDGNTLIPIPNLQNLRTISFHSGRSYHQDELKPNWKGLFKNDYLFKNIKHRIANISINYDSLPVIKVTLDA